MGEEHLDWVVDVASRRMLCEEVGRSELFNEKNVLGLARKVVDSSTGFVVTVNGEPAGVIAGLLIPNLFNPELLTLAEFIWYVLPEHRKGRAGWLLLAAWESLARMSDVHDTTLSILPSTTVALEKQGYRMVEQSYRKTF